MKNRFNLFDIPIDTDKKDVMITKIESFLEGSKKHQICTVNSEFIIFSQKDDIFKKILLNSSLNLADGFGVMWASKFIDLKINNSGLAKIILVIIYWLVYIIRIPFTPSFFKHPIQERITGSDFIWDIAHIAAKNHSRIFLLGGAPTIAERTALILQTKIPNLHVSGVHSGNPSQTEEIIEAINKSKASILMVAYGMPKQEYWIYNNLNRTNCKIAIGVGGTFDFIAGTRRRAPKWMQKTGLEWLYRLIKEPRRIIRQLSIPHLMIKVLKYKINEK